MKISELSATTGISIATLKFYLREGLLPAGRLTSPNQADYHEVHVRRANLIRALREIAGLSISRIRSLTAALDGGETVYDVLGQAVDALGGESITSFTPAQLATAEELDRFLAAFGLPARPESLARQQLITAFTSVRELLFPGIPVGLLAPYAEAAISIATMEQQATPGLLELSPESTLEKAILGLALFEPIIIGLRRLAQEKLVHEALGIPIPQPAS